MPTLRIGDEHNAILLIQQSQTDPQKAVAELVENSIDAKARNIVIKRFRRGDTICLSVLDDGEGIRPGEDGTPDVEYVATHLCDSIKRQLDAKSRERVQGQFGIGLLGFAAVGEDLVLCSKRPGTTTRGITLHAYMRDYELDSHGKELARPGTEAEIRNLRREVQHRLTAEKLHRYLSEELRDRIKSTKVRIQLEDRVGTNRSMVVTPRDFSGIPLSSGRRTIQTGHGVLRLDLYATFPKEGGRACISIARNGTRLLSDMLECEELCHSPWDMNRMEGVVDFSGLNPAPATRRGFLLDQVYQEFLRQLEKVEPGIRLELEKLEERAEEQLNREFRERLEQAFAEAMEELPDEYFWFEREGSAVETQGKTSRSGGRTRVKPVLLSPGPLAEVRITPRIALIAPQERRVLVAKCFDPKGATIPTGVSFQWSVNSPLVVLAPSGQATTVEGRGKEGEAVVRVVARLKGDERCSESKVVVTKTRRQAGLPPPELQHAPMESWRSRYATDQGVLEINSGHRDYERATAGGVRSRLRYVAQLYAKELVLLNFGSARPETILERMIEVTTALEPRL
jgi:hypothetical protein